VKKDNEIFNLLKSALPGPRATIPGVSGVRNISRPVGIPRRGPIAAKPAIRPVQTTTPSMGVPDLEVTSPKPSVPSIKPNTTPKPSAKVDVVDSSKMVIDLSRKVKFDAYGRPIKPSSSLTKGLTSRGIAEAMIKAEIRRRKKMRAVQKGIQRAKIENIKINAWYKIKTLQYNALSKKGLLVASTIAGIYMFMTGRTPKVESKEIQPIIQDFPKQSKPEVDMLMFHLKNINEIIKDDYSSYEDSYDKDEVLAINKLIISLYKKLKEIKSYNLDLDSPDSAREFAEKIKQIKTDASELSVQINDMGMVGPENEASVAEFREYLISFIEELTAYHYQQLIKTYIFD